MHNSNPDLRDIEREMAKCLQRMWEERLAALGPVGVPGGLTIYRAPNPKRRKSFDQSVSDPFNIYRVCF